MSHPYCCPNCKTNRSRFNVIEQTPIYVKLDPHSGTIIQMYADDELEAYHLPYRGPGIPRTMCVLRFDRRREDIHRLWLSGQLDNYRIYFHLSVSQLQ